MVKRTSFFELTCNPPDNPPMMHSQLHPSAHPLHEPLNLLHSYLQQSLDLTYLKYQPVTERQVVMDVLLMLSGCESPTFERGGGTGCYMEVRGKRRPVLTHMSTHGFDNVIDRYIKMGRVVTEVE
jgi:hypothetical protein